MTIAVKRPRPARSPKSVRPAPPPPEKKTIPIVRRCLVGGEDPAVTFGVFCPAQEATVPAERCAECGFLTRFPDHATAPGATIECTPPGMHAQTSARSSPRIDMDEAAARTPLGEILRHRVVCVTPDTSVETMMSLMIEHGLESFPVVDAAWKLVGIVSKADIVRVHFADDTGEDAPNANAGIERGFHVERGAGETVADLMTPAVHSLPEDARLAHAVSLMAAESIHQVPVLSADGAVVGVVTSLDCLRWMSRQMGYEVAPPGE